MLTNQNGWQVPVFNTGFSDTRILAANPNRGKMVYYNPNAVADIYISFGRSLQYSSCVRLAPNEKWVDDVNASMDEVWIGSNIQDAKIVTIETFGGK